MIKFSSSLSDEPSSLAFRSITSQKLERLSDTVENLHIWQTMCRKVRLTSELKRQTDPALIGAAASLCALSALTSLRTNQIIILLSDFLCFEENQDYNLQITRRQLGAHAACSVIQKVGDGSNEFYSHYFEKNAVGFPVLKNVFIEQVGQKRDGRNYRGMSFELKAIDAASLSVDAFFAEAGTKAKGFLRRTFKFRLDSVSDTCTRQTMRDDCEKIRTIMSPDLNEAVGIPLSGAFDIVV